MRSQNEILMVFFFLLYYVRKGHQKKSLNSKSHELHSNVFSTQAITRTIISMCYNLVLYIRTVFGQHLKHECAMSLYRAQKQKPTNNKLKDYEERRKEKKQQWCVYIRKHMPSKADYRLRFVMGLGNLSKALWETGRIAQQ